MSRVRKTCKKLFFLFDPHSCVLTYLDIIFLASNGKYVLTGCPREDQRDVVH